MNDRSLEFYGWHGMMLGCYAAMPEAERAELLAWEKIWVTGDGQRGTSDWPGWEKYIGKVPAPERMHPVYRKGSIPYAKRLATFKRDGFQCAECSSTEDLSIDHVVPERHGGTLELENLRVLCKSCNSRKGARQ